MASTLAIQLERLKAAASPSAPSVRGKPSLLFSYQDAADIDVDTIYHLGLAGLQDLASRDSRFRVFESSLFSRDLVSQNREHHNKEWNAQVSAVISGFLQLLSNYFLQPSAFKTLEYLIRKFKVNELEVHELLLCALPYHTTNEFVRLVQVLALKSSPWEFLGKVQTNGVSLPRANLVHRCLKHQEVLKAICEGALTAARPDVVNRTYLSFFAVTVCETLQAMRRVKEDTVALLLPYLLAGLQKGVVADFRGASIMIFSQLAAKAPLGLKLLSKLIVQLAKGAEPRDAAVVALILAQLSRSQPHLTALPAKALKAALKLPGFDQELSSVASTATSSSLLRLVTSSLCSALPQHPSLGAHLLSTLHTTALPPDVAESLASLLLQEGARCSQGTQAASLEEGADGSTPSVKEVVLRAVRILEQRYPSEVDTATNKLLGQAQADPASDDQDQDQDNDTSLGGVDEKSALLGFVKAAFHGGMHCPVSEELGSMTLARAANAPASSVRAMAVQQIGDLLEATELPAASRSAAETLIIHRLADDDWGVVKAVLHLKALTSMAPAALVPAVTAVLRRAEAAVTEPAAAAAGMKAISVLASLLDGDNLVVVASPLVPYLLLTPALHRLCFAAHRALSACSHPLFAHLEAPQDNTKRPKKVPTGITFAVADDDGVITSSIQALSKAIVDTPKLVPAVAQLALATSASGRHLLLLALAHACTTDPSAHSAAVAIIDIVKATWPQASPSLPEPTDPSATWVAQATAIFTPTCLPLATYIPMLHNSLPHLHAIVHLQALHAAVALLAPNPGDSIFSSTFDTLTHLRPPEPFYPHLDTLANKLPATTSVPFLAQHMVTAPDANPAATIAHILSTLVPRPEVPLDALKAILPNILTALSSSHQPLRVGALHLAAATRERLHEPPTVGPVGSAPLLAEFLNSLLVHGELIKNDAASLALLVNNTLCPQQASNSADPSPRLPTITLPTSAAAINATWAFLNSSLSSLSGSAASANVLCLLSCLSNAADPGPVLKASLPQLKRIVSAPAGSLNAVDIQLAAAILALVTPATHSQAPASIPLLLAIITAPPTPTLRASAFTALSPELFSSLSEKQQGDVLKVLLSASAADPDVDCRAAARACLEAAPVSAVAVAHLLAVQVAAAVEPAAQGLPTPSKKKKQQPAATSTSATDDVSLAKAIEALEMLQWKAPIPSPSSDLLAALQALVVTLLPAITSIAVPHSEGESASPTKDSGALSGYAVQLALAAIKRVLEEGDASAPGAVDLDVVVACAQRAPDIVVRNAALLVVAAMAASSPESTLDHVLQVMAVVNEAAVMQEDVYSTRIATAAMTAVVPAWVKAGRPTSDLWGAVVSSLGAVPPTRRLALLSTLKEVLPEEEGVHVAMLHLLRLAVPPSAQHASPATADADEYAADKMIWAPEVAALLSLQVPACARLRAFSRLLSASLEGSHPEEALPRTVVAFVGAQLQVKSLLVAARKLLVSSSEGMTPQMAELQDGGEGLINSALAQLQAVGTKMDSEASTSARSLQAAAAGLHSLIRALEGVLPSAHYIQALVQLQGPHSTDACRRRTLRLLASKLSAVQQEADDLAVLAPTKKQARLSAITAAAMELLPNLPFLLDPSASSPTTRQAALLAIDALILQFATSSPSTIASTLPHIITACSDISPAVRASALTSVATIIRALGHKVVAHVPLAVKTILAAANSSAQAIADSPEHPDSTQDSSEQAAVQQMAFVLAAALAALQALIEHTAALMSPYIGAVLQLLLRPEVLECSSTHCSTFGARLRHSLPASVSPRVLLGPLHDQLGPALKAGAKPATALLEICTAAAAAMDSRSAAAYHDKLFSLFLTALEVRQTQPPSLLPGDGIFEVEREAVRGAVALVMKLSEANFKPLFLSLMEWTNEVTERSAADSTTPVPSDNMGRICAMMSLAEALAHRLRSVFVPYFRYLLDVCVHFLTSRSALDSRALKRLKKKRRESLAADGDGSSAPVSAVDLETSWVLRAKIVRSLHRCFLYDSVAFLDQDRFNRLLHPLIEQLDAEPPAEVAAALARQCADAELDGCVETTASLDLMGRAVVGCLAQMATSAGSDAMWKPLNQQVLMMTRSTSARTRLLGLEVSSQLIGRLREEFLVLLPESIPFLAELLEDSDVGVERRTQEVVKILEELSGEKLDEYMK